MADVFTGQENRRLHPSALKMRQRLQSAPEKLKSPMTAKTFNTPLPTGRKAFGAVNKMALTPAVNPQEKKLLKPQETKVKPAPQMKLEEYPEVEKFFPYDPLEFQKCSIPEDVFIVSALALPGLACFPPAPHPYEEDLDLSEPLRSPSPVEMPRRSGCSELDEFLQTIEELTIELPPEAD